MKKMVAILIMISSVLITSVACNNDIGTSRIDSDNIYSVVGSNNSSISKVSGATSNEDDLSESASSSEYEIVVNPDVDASISEVAVRIIEQFPATLYPAEPFLGVRFLRIYYGYKVDDAWYYAPSENYNLQSMHSVSTKHRAVSKSHIVKIGDFVLFAVPMRNIEQYSSYEIKDTLGSYVMEIDEYYTPTDYYSDPSSYEEDAISTEFVHYIENPERDFEGSATYGFHKWYYIILKYDEIPEDYEMYIITNSLVDGVEEEYVQTLTYQDIAEKLE